MVNISTTVLNINRDTVSEGNVVKKRPTVVQNISASPRLISWVESINIGGYNKTIFYTEIDSNFKKGDRVFIINGKYDNDLLIKSDRYKSGSDGYKVLDIDRCKITLDIEFTNELPFLDDSLDNFIKVHHIVNQREFDYINDQYIARDVFTNKYTTGQNNIIFIDKAYSGKILTTLLPGLGYNNGAPSAGFYVRDTNSPANWINITSNFITNNLSPYLSTNFSNNGRLKIIGGSFYYSGREYRDSDVYYYDSTKNSWEIDSNYIRPFITTSNFRRGKFKGSFNKGIYGSFTEKINWDGVDSSWNGGSVVNSEWKSGIINSNPISGSDKSYFTEFDDLGYPVQKDNINNNRGFGYSYFINMDLYTSKVINNGNFINCNIGLTNSAGGTYSAVDKYYKNLPISAPNTVNKGNFTSCKFDSVDVSNAVVNNCRISNSYFNNTKSVNSHLDNVVFYNSSYNGDNLIKIKDYDEWNVYLNDNDTTGVSYKVYKFYISESSYFRMKSLDKFLIKGLKIRTDDYWSLQYNKILNFFDRGFILDSYSDTEDVIVGTTFDKETIDFTCKISTKAENTYKLSSYHNTLTNTYYTATYSVNSINLPSIDITVRIEPTPSFFTKNDYNYNFVSLTSSTADASYIGDNIDITNAYIVDSYFNGGIFENSNWNSGDLYNYNKYSLIDGLADIGQYNISTFSSTQIKMPYTYDPLRLKDEYYKLGDIVYLNSIDYNNGSTVTRLPNIWKIDSFSFSSFILSEYLIGTTSTIVSSLTGSGVFLTSPDGLTSSVYGTNRYNYLHKVRINNSTIKGGILRRSFISNSTIYSDTFDNSDYLLSNKKNLKELLIIDSIFSKTKNSIKSGLITNSYLNKGNDIWYNGILWRSIWENGIFNNGSVVEVSWINGTFNSGIFYQNKTSLNNKSFFTNKESSYYKSSVNSTILTVNNRFTWENGTFNNGQFYESVWENGTFNNGKIFKSTWINGIFNDGIFGDEKFNLTDNNFYGGTFSKGVVINSNFYSGGTYSTGFNGINWKNGVFQSGLFGNDTKNSLATAIWSDGVFNDGNFTNTAIWKNGIFNGGLFTSYYGCTYSLSNIQSQYTWQNGIFNGGEFGTGKGLTNSNWWNGEMYGGVFKGKVWNNGLLTSGEFQGSSVYSSVGGYASSNASTFIKSFTSSYYGLWRDGFITDTKDKIVKDKEYFTKSVRSSEEVKFTTNISLKKAVIKNALWITGTFSHKNGEMNNCVWLDGTFDDGTFKNSSFNPYVERNLVGLPQTLGTELVYDSNFGFTGTSSGWIPVSNASSSFGVLSNTAVYTSTFNGPTSLRLQNNKTYLELGKYEIKLDIVTYSSVYSNIQLGIYIGTASSITSGNVYNSAYGPLTLGTNTITYQTNGGSVSLHVAMGSTGSIKLDNFSIKKIMPTFNLNDNTCVWKNGRFDGGDFNISKWEQGLFIGGTAYGMIWKSGTSNYMNAYNVFWEDGLWRNGNWNGSPFEFKGTVEDDYVKQIIYRGMSWSGTSSCHIWNIFENMGDPVFILSVTNTSVYRNDYIKNSNGVFILQL
jgi:hypothetical protein